MKESFWFRHDYNARNDERILELRAEHGSEGYGIYWMLIEAMAESSSGHLSRGAVAGLAIGLGVEKNLLLNVIDTCIRVGLFDQENDKFCSQRILRHKAERAAFSDAGRRGALAKRSHFSSQASAPPVAPLKRAEESRAEQKRKETYAVRPETTSLIEYIDSLCTEYGMQNKVNTKALDIQVQRHLTTGIHLRVEARKCMSWLIEHGKKDISAQRLSNWFEKAREIQKREHNKGLEKREKIGKPNEQTFSIDPAVRARLTSPTNAAM